jgi:hypothetical protein
LLGEGSGLAVLSLWITVRPCHGSSFGQTMDSNPRIPRQILWAWQYCVCVVADHIFGGRCHPGHGLTKHGKHRVRAQAEPGTGLDDMGVVGLEFVALYRSSTWSWNFWLRLMRPGSPAAARRPGSPAAARRPAVDRRCILRECRNNVADVYGLQVSSLWHCWLFPVFSGLCGLAKAPKTSAQTQGLSLFQGDHHRWMDIYSIIGMLIHITRQTYRLIKRMNSQGFDISLFMEGRTNNNEDGLRIARF